MPQKDQIDKLVEFFEKTKCTLGKREILTIQFAKTFLEDADWDVDAAVDAHRDFRKRPRKGRGNLEAESNFPGPDNL